MARFEFDEEMLENLMDADENIQNLLMDSRAPKLRYVVKDAFHKNNLKQRYQRRNEQNIDSNIGK